MEHLTKTHYREIIKTMNKLSVDMLKQIGEYFLGQVDVAKSDIRYLEVDEVRQNFNKTNSLRRVTNSLYYLTIRKYIQYKKDGDKAKIVLTTQGAMQFFKYCDIVTKEKLNPGKMSLVIVEVTDDKRDIRDFLRRRLKQSGFQGIGRGVYWSRYKLNNNIKPYSNLYGLEKMVYAGEFKIIS